MTKKNIRTVAFVAITMISVNSFAQDRQRGGGERRQRLSPEEMFEKLDADENELVTKEELSENKMGERLLENFDAIDTDESGDIKLEELNAFIEKRKAERRKS